jgi:hypothetical protein
MFGELQNEDLWNAGIRDILLLAPRRMKCETVEKRFRVHPSRVDWATTFDKQTL